MANKANRYALADLRGRLVRLQGYHPKDVAHLVPLPQFRRPKSEFELHVVKGLAETRDVNTALPGYRRFTINVKKVRRMLSRHFRNLGRLPGEKHEAYHAELLAAHKLPGGAASFINSTMNRLAAA